MRKTVGVRLLVLAQLAGCSLSGTDTGNPATGDSRYECVSDARSVPELYELSVKELASDDEAAEFGLSAADVLAYAEGKHTLSLGWLDLQDRPLPHAAVDDAIEVTLSRRATPPRVVDYTWLDESVPVAHGQVDRLEIDVRVAVLLVNTGLEFEADGVLRVDERGFVTVGDSCSFSSIRFTPTVRDFVGLEHVEPSWVDLSDPRTSLWLTFSEKRLSGFMSFRAWPAAAEMPQRIEVTFPADNHCRGSAARLRVDETTFGASAQQALKWAAGVADRNATWSAGPSSQLSVTRADLEPWVCVTDDSALVSGYMLHSTGTVELNSDDGRVSMREKADFTAYLDLEGRVYRFDTSLWIGSPQAAVTEAELIARTGLDELDLSDFQAGGWLEFVDYIDATETDAGVPKINGMLRVSGGEPFTDCPACEQEGVECTQHQLYYCMSLAPTTLLEALWE